MKTVTASEANRRFSRVLHDATRGEEFVILSRGKPVATIGPINRTTGKAGRTARTTLLARLRRQASSGHTWTRDELYED